MQPFNFRTSRLRESYGSSVDHLDLLFSRWGRLMIQTSASRVAPALSQHARHDPSSSVKLAPGGTKSNYAGHTFTQQLSDLVGGPIQKIIHAFVPRSRTE
jgi:hypothetical protein